MNPERDEVRKCQTSCQHVSGREQPMELTFVDADTIGFDRQTYVRILIAIAKADPANAAPEYAYVRKQAARLGVDCDRMFSTTDKSFLWAIAIGRQVSDRWVQMFRLVEISFTASTISTESC
jgi:hypothetical protein